MDAESEPKISFGPGLHAPAGQQVDVSAYEQYLGRWSRLFVPAVLTAAEVAIGERVLDVAVGPGEAAAIALDRVGPAGLVVGVDISRDMLEAARTRLTDDRFRVAAMDGQALAFPAARFDCVLCHLGLMFFPDPVRGLAEFRRVLRTDGRAAVCVISTPERAPLWSLLAESLSHYLPEQRETLYLSFGLADAARLGRMLGSAGFRDVRVFRERHDTTFESFDEYWRPIEEGVGSMPHVYRALPEETRRAVRRDVEARMSRFETGGQLRMSLEMLIGAGRA